MLSGERGVIAPDEFAVILGGGVGFVGKLYGGSSRSSLLLGSSGISKG
jgi:hypothetical protein